MEKAREREFGGEECDAKRDMKAVAIEIGI